MDIDTKSELFKEFYYEFWNINSDYFFSDDEIVQNTLNKSYMDLSDYELTEYEKAKKEYLDSLNDLGL